MKVKCIKNFNGDIDNPRTMDVFEKYNQSILRGLKFEVGDTYELKILHPGSGKRVNRGMLTPNTIYEISSVDMGSNYVHFDRETFRKYFRSIRYNRIKSIDKILNG